MFQFKRVEKIEYANINPLLTGFNTIKTKIPQWYRDSDFLIPQEKLISKNNSRWEDKGVKTCIPFLDSLTSGYCLELSTDIFIGKNQYGYPYVDWKPGISAPVGERKNDPNDKIPTPAGHHDAHFIWLTQSVFKLPPGYSAFITHPLNRFDLPFTTMSGVVDADGLMHKGNLPFFIKDKFEGYVEKGTPYAQIIPFKRENWKMEENKNLISLSDYNNAQSHSVHYGWYKKNIWKKKSFE